MKYLLSTYCLAGSVLDTGNWTFRTDAVPALQEDSVLALTFSKSDDSYRTLFLSERREDRCLKSCTSMWQSFGDLRLAGSRRPVVAGADTVSLRRRPVLFLGRARVRSNLKFCHRSLLRVPAGRVFSGPHWSSAWTQCIA